MLIYSGGIGDEETVREELELNRGGARSLDEVSTKKEKEWSG